MSISRVSIFSTPSNKIIREGITVVKTSSGVVYLKNNVKKKDDSTH